MAIHLIRKLEQFTRLSADDRQALERIASLKFKRLKPRDDIIREGDKPGNLNLILDGWACRYKVLEDGRRQITAFLVPGDICDLRMFILKEMDHSIGAISALSLAEIPSEALMEVTHSSPRLSHALWWNSLVEEAIAREWITVVGQREAPERLAHLFCELFLRLKGVGLTHEGPEGPSFELPLTQEQVADATGMTTVHVNRTLQQMREQELIIWKGRTIVIPDLERLRDVALFNPNYLHLDHAGKGFDANDL